MIPELTYGRKNEKEVSVDDVESGLACNCTCPGCGDRLVAKKGDIKVHHFAHYSKPDRLSCYETMIHCLAKEIVEEERRIFLPSLRVYPTRVLRLYPCNRATFRARCERMKLVRDIVHQGTVKTGKVLVETRMGDIIPDVACMVNGQWLLVEFHVTHRVNDEKLAKIQRLNLPAIEIDLSKVDRRILRDELRSILVHGNGARAKWIYHPRLEAVQREIDGAYEAHCRDVEKERRERQRLSEQAMALQRGATEYSGSPAMKKENRRQHDMLVHPLSAEGRWNAFESGNGLSPADEEALRRFTVRWPTWMQEERRYNATLCENADGSWNHEKWVMLDGELMREAARLTQAERGLRQEASA